MPLGTWADDRHIQVAGRRFLAAPSIAPASDELVIAKPREVIDRYLDLIEDQKPQHIVELGTKAGGSAALLTLAARPKRFLTVDLSPVVPVALAALIDSEDLHHVLVTECGLDQSDRRALKAALDEAFESHPLDLVIDDASHILQPTRASFEVLFPRLRPGGTYVIEDWNAELLTAERVARIVPPTDPEFSTRLQNVQAVLAITNDPSRDLPQAIIDKLSTAHAARPAGEVVSMFAALIESAATADIVAEDDLDVKPSRPMADLAVELTMIAATRRDIIDEVAIDADWIRVRRGEAELDTTFRLGGVWGDHFGYLRP